jgi:hypothetical protein
MQLLFILFEGYKQVMSLSSQSVPLVTLNSSGNPNLPAQEFIIMKIAAFVALTMAIIAVASPLTTGVDIEAAGYCCPFFCTGNANCPGEHGCGGIFGQCCSPAHPC